VETKKQKAKKRTASYRQIHNARWVVLDPGGAPRGRRRELLKDALWATPFRCFQNGIFLPPEFPRAARLREIYEQLMAAAPRVASGSGR
jgi:hypothetical protein